jgi:predicted O-methyltransferase YrrM
MDAGTLLHFLSLSVRRPTEFYDRLVDLRDRKAQAESDPVEPDSYDPIEVVHSLLGISGGDCCRDRVAAVSSQIREGLTGEHHNDGSPMLGAMLNCVVHHERPLKVVETGVARGVSSAHILAAMRQNNDGHLWSIDLPPLRPDWFKQSRTAVAEPLRSRWSYIRGASRRYLPPLLEQLQQIDVFVHDSAHTLPNMLWEMRLAWPHIRRGGWLFCDDVYANAAFGRVRDEVGATARVLKDRQTGDVIGILRNTSQL